MKKPLMLLNKKEMIKITLCLTMSLTASLLFVVPDKSIAAFSSESREGVKGLYALLKMLCF